MLLMPPKASAQILEKYTSAKLININNSYESDPRVKILTQYLTKHDSPLVDSAHTFVEAADKYNLDWKLVASISGLESSFGIHIPYNSYNGWGWGVYGDNVIRFKSWDEAIWTISQALREKYLKDNPISDPYLIGPTYASSPTWAVRVDSIMNQIHEFEVLNAKDQLSISI